MALGAICGTQTRAEILKATFVVLGERVVMGRRVASGLQVRSGAGADAKTREATESKMTAGSNTETAGAMGKSKETAGSEAWQVQKVEWILKWEWIQS